MPDFTRIFAESGLKNTISDVEYDGGWDDIVGSNPPSFKDFNSIMNEQDSKLADIAQAGIVDWDAAIPYQAGAWARSTVDNAVYELLPAGDPTNEPSASPADWALTYSLGSNFLSAVKTNIFSTTSTTPVDIPQLSITASLSSSSNKFIINCGVFADNSGNGIATYIDIARDGVAISPADAAGNRTRANGYGYGLGGVDFSMNSNAIILEDSPSDTDPHTYTVRIWAESNTAYVNRSGTSDLDVTRTPRLTSAFTVQEVF